jgi:t-SNARE complex subunit (syntaxin)
MPEALSDASSAGREGRAYVMLIIIIIICIIIFIFIFILFFVIGMLI